MSFQARKNSDDQIFFRQLYIKHHDMMFKCAFKILKNHHEAEDALQSVLLKLWSCTNTLRKVAPDKLAGYLYSTTRNYCLTLIERNKVKNNRFVSIEDFSEVILVLENTPELEVMSNRENSLFYETLDKLPSQYKQIILDKLSLDMTDEEIANHIGIKKTYVRECLSRAKAKFREIYTQKSDETEKVGK